MTEPVPYSAFLAMEEQLERERDEARAELAAYKASRTTVDDGLWAQVLVDGGEVKILPGVTCTMQGRYVMAKVEGKPEIHMNEDKIQHALTVLMAIKRAKEVMR